VREAKIQGFVVYDIWERKVFQRGRMYRLDEDRMREAFEEYGIEIVIGLAGKLDENLQALADDDFIDYYYHPIPDNKISDEDEQWLLETAEETAADINYFPGLTVLSHCNAGRNRSALMNALIIRQLGNLTGKEARLKVQKERPNALANEHFVEFLDKLPRPGTKVEKSVPEPEPEYSLDDPERPLRIVIVMAGAGSAGKSTTTLNYAIGDPDERDFEFDWEDRNGNPRHDKVKYTLYENCALTGNHKSGTDCNNAPSLVKAAFQKCIEERDVVIVDGFCSSPQWAIMIDEQEGYDFHVVILHFDFTAEEILTRLASRRGVDKESIRERMYGKSVNRPGVLLRRFDELCHWPQDVITVYYDDSTEEIVKMLDETVDDLWKEYGYELEAV